MTETKVPITLWSLFLTLLKIGSISWGGFMSLLSVVQKEFAEKKQLVREEVILDGISLASVLPGPVAFNVIAYLGYHLRGIRGTLVSMLAIILPSFLMIIGLAYVYTRYDHLPQMHTFFLGVLPAVSAIILTVAVSMAKKQLRDFRQVLICVAAGLILLTVRSYFVTLGIIVVSSTTGFLLYGKEIGSGQPVSEKTRISGLKFTVLLLSLTLTLALLLWSLPVFSRERGELLRQLGLTFSGISLTLFGGGYVIIPAMQQVLVDGLHWLNTQEFADAIAMGQITPGPIFISATFIGFKLAGLSGAVIATIAIFLPPAVVMVCCSRFLEQINRSTALQAAFRGLRPAVIGMIFSAAFTILKDMEMSWQAGLIFILVLLLAFRFKSGVVYLIPVSGLAGILLFSFNA